MDLHENITFEIFISDSLQASLTYKPSYWGEEKLFEENFKSEKKQKNSVTLDSSGPPDIT